MSAEAVGGDLKQNRTFLFLQEFAFAFVGIDHGKRIVTIHPFGMHLLRIDAGTDAGCHAVSHGLTAGLASHAVLVVHDVDDDRQSAFHIPFPQLFKLVHGGKGNAFPYGTAGHAGITDIGHHDAGFAVYLFIQGGTYRYVTAAANNGIVGIHSEGSEKGMHASAQSPVKSGLAGKNLSQGTIDQKPAGQRFRIAGEFFRNDAKNLSVEKGFHDGIPACRPEADEWR